MPAKRPPSLFTSGCTHRPGHVTTTSQSDARMSKFVNLLKIEQQSQNLLLEVNPRSTSFFNPQQVFLLRDNLITQGEKRETMLDNKWRVLFVVFRCLYTYGIYLHARLHLTSHYKMLKLFVSKLSNAKSKEPT